MIPKLLHFIWLGAAPLPDVMRGWVQGWHRLNYDDGWKVVFWRHDTGLGTLVADDVCFHLRTGSSHPGLLARACHLAQRANIWRYDVVHQHGGVYLDTDVEPLLPIGKVLDGLEAFTVPHLQDPSYLANSVFGATPGHPFARDLVATLPDRDPAISLSMGSRHLTEVAGCHPEVARLTPDIFLHDMNPWTVQSGVRGTVFVNPKTTVGVHHFAAFWHGAGFKPIDRGEK